MNLSFVSKPTANQPSTTAGPNLVEVAAKELSEETGLPKWAIYTIAIRKKTNTKATVVSLYHFLQWS